MNHASWLRATVAIAFAACALYPVLAGSALGDIGVDALAEAVGALCRTDYARREGEPFSAKAYRVRRVGGVRFTYVKVTGGVLHARDEVQTLSGACKVAAVLAPQGGKLLTMGEAHAGQTVGGWISVSGASPSPSQTTPMISGMTSLERRTQTSLPMRTRLRQISS